MYLPAKLYELSCDRMIKNFPSRYLILDFNHHNHLWGANQENGQGKAVEHLIDNHNLILFNDSIHTQFDKVKLAPHSIFPFVMPIYTWMLHVKFHQID